MADGARLMRLLEGRRQSIRRLHRLALALAVGAGVAAIAAALALIPSAAVLTAQDVAPADADGDGIPDALENAVLGTDPHRRSSSGAIPESWLHKYGLDISDADLPNRTARYPRAGEAPAVYGSAGLPTTFRMSLWDVYAYKRPEGWDEAARGAWDSELDPTRYDVAASGVPYSWLAFHGLDPRLTSTLDAIPEGASVPWTPREAYLRGLHPLVRDGDADGLDDEEELAIGTSPWSFSTTGTGIADGWLVRHRFDPLDAAVAYQDTDHDGLSNLEEFDASMRLDPAATLRGGGLDPRALSTAGGPIPDGWLVRYHLDPLERDIHLRITEYAPPLVEDGPSRPLRVEDEYRVKRPPLWNETQRGPWWGGTDPTHDDTDGDGLSDALEILGWLVHIAGEERRVFSDPTRIDTDADGLTDMEEYEGKSGTLEFPRTDPSNADTDHDGLTDGEELGRVLWRGRALPRLDPTRPDTDDDGLLDGAEAAYWYGRHRDAVDGQRYAWGPEPRLGVAEALAVGLGSGARFDLSRLLPDGDADGDGIPNILDPDSDGDGLLDGWEVRPALYGTTPLASPHPRSSTDPANPDTDQDGLPDRWEIEHARFDAELGGWNLDPSKWSSYHDAIDDGSRDLDDDSITWYSFHRTPSGLVAQSHAFRATNRVEYEAGSHPNQRSSSPDGLPDGWKIFWGRAYFSLPPSELGDVYPGAPGELEVPRDRPTPRIGADDAFQIATWSYRRFQPTDESRLLPGETAVLRDFRDALGDAKSVLMVTGEATFTYASAFENLTNPYLDDTDGDLMSDIWESVWRQLGQGRNRVSPVAFDADVDFDGDGLPNLGEYHARSDPYRRDSDFGGALDDIEALLGLDPMAPDDDGLALEARLDTDGDGIPDVTEIRGFFVLGRKVQTDPRDVDSDRDGLLDGASLSELVGRPLRASEPADLERVDALEARGLLVIRYPDGTLEVPGERAYGSDPTQASTAGDGVPDGWLARHGLPPGQRTGAHDAYVYGRPAWWNVSEHGTWWWGAAPGAPPGRDLDRDGLDDLNGEDPLPFANRLNQLPLGHPSEAGIDSIERLRRAQAYGDRLRPAVPDRATTMLTLDALPEVIRDDQVVVFSGNLTAADGTPVRNATVIVSVGVRAVVIGSAVTDDAGRYAGTVTIAREIAAPAASAGVPVFGAADGTGVHRNPLAAILALDTREPLPAFAWSYNISPYAQGRQASLYALANGTRVAGVLGNESASQSVRLNLSVGATFNLPAVGGPGESVILNATVTDSLGRPVAGVALQLVEPENVVQSNAEGRASVPIRLPNHGGDYTFAVVYPVGDGRIATVNLSIQVLEPVALDLSGPPFAVQPSESFGLVGTLRRAAGGPVAGGVVTVHVGQVEEVVHTDVTGRWRLTAMVPRDANLGSMPIAASFAGNATLSSARTEGAIEVKAAPRWETESVRAFRGENVTLRARLVDHVGSPMAGRDVAFAFGARSFTARTDGNGVATVSFSLGAEPAGSRAVIVRLTDPAEGAQPTSIPLLVRARAKLDLAPVVGIRGAPLAVKGVLADERGSPLPHQAVDLEVAGAHARALTGPDGAFSAQFSFGPELAPGRLIVAVRYDGTPDGIWLSTSSSQPVAYKDSPRVILATTTLLLQRPALDGRVTTQFGEPIGRRDISLQGPWGLVPLVSDANGVFRTLLSFPQGQALGRIEISAILNADDLLHGTASTLSVALKDAGKLDLDLPASFKEGQLASIRFAATDSRGSAVRDAVPRVAMDGAALPASIERDQIVFRIPPASAGRHTLLVEIGSEFVEVPSVQREVDVRAGTRLSLSGVERAPPGSPGRIDLRLEGSAGPVGPVTLLVFGTGPVPLLVTTDEMGRVSVPIPALRTGVSEYNVVFPGEGPYGASSLSVSVASQTVPLATGIGTAAMLTGALFALLAIAIAVFLVRRARARPASVLRVAARRLRSDRPDIKALYDAYLRLLELAGVTEDAGDTLTFGDLVERFTADRDLSGDDARVLTHAFNEAVYAPQLIEASLLHAASAALERMADRIGRADSA